MIELALRVEEIPTPASVISKRQEIPLQYLEQIFNNLKKRGLVKTVRGPRGGYILSRESSKISVKDIMHALEGKEQLLECLEKKSALCRRRDNCRARRFWSRLDRAIGEIMARTTLKDLSRGPRPKEKTYNIGHRYLFQI